MKDTIDGIISAMTLEEKVSLLSGADWWHTRSVERLGIPAIKMTDGPHGARVVVGGPEARTGLPATCFPTASAMAATWNPELIERVGRALGEEVKAKGCDVLLAPTVNIHRSPLGGRNFESFSEDPHLAARMAVAYIRGLQSQRVAACVKHLACNNSEYERMVISSQVSDRALREIYLPAFEAAVQQAGSWALMCAYNKLNGTYASEHRRLLTHILKEEWGFEGPVISDWYAVHDRAAAVGAGLDLEMPGPGPVAVEELLSAVRSGRLAEARIDDAVRRILRLFSQTGRLEQQPPLPAGALDTPERRLLARQVAHEAIVLLQNRRGLLPLDPQAVKRIAVVGPAANQMVIKGSGSSRVNPYYSVSPLAALRERLQGAAEIVYQQGCSYDGSAPPLQEGSVVLTTGLGEIGLQGEYFPNPDFTGTPVSVADSLIGLPGRVAQLEGFAGLDFSVRWMGRLLPPLDGLYRFSLSSTGLSRILIDDELVVDNWGNRDPQPYGARASAASGSVTLSAGAAHRLLIEYSRSDEPLFGLQVGCDLPSPHDAMSMAVELASRSDVVLIFAGLPDQFDSEGYDRPHMELTGGQATLIERIARANQNTVVILNNGAPVAMSRWIDQVGAVLEGWLPGQEGGTAVVDLLLGEVSPSGRLPLTFPRWLEDNPAYVNYPGENEVVSYGEGIFVGYRYYDKKEIAPLFPFGHGLSYTTFEYTDLQLSCRELGPGEDLGVSVRITNCGSRAGKEVVQLYLTESQPRVARPPKELKGFAKIELAPAETATVALTIQQRDLAFFDPGKQAWMANAGQYRVLVGSSSRDIRAAAGFRLTAPYLQPVGAPAQVPGRLPRLSAETKLSEVLKDPQGRAVLRKHLGRLLEHHRYLGFSGYSISQVARYAPDQVPAQVAAAIGRELEAIE